jgi:hypothetical protein
MGDKKKWDLSKLHALEAACEWIRKESGALMVVAIRVEDSAIAVDPAMPAGDLVPRLELETEALAEKVEMTRQAAREKAAKREC